MGGEKPYLAGSLEFANLYGLASRLQVSQMVGKGLLDYSHAVILSGSPYWLLGFAKRYGEMGVMRKKLNEVELARIVASQEPGFWASSVEEVPPLVGLQEATEMLGVASSMSLSAVTRAGRFIEPDYRLSGSPLWLLDTILEGLGPIRARARQLAWAVDPAVEAALRQGRYEGPGSRVLPRGRAAKKPAGDRS